MITVTLDPADRRPLYEQLYLHIREEINKGRLTAGERLPSKRALASHLKISVITVEGAYSQLLAEGYIRSEPKRGFFVQALEPSVSAPPSVPQAPEPISSPKASFRYDFSTNAVDTALFPFSTWAKLSREILSGGDTSLLDALPPQGAVELRDAIVHHLYHFRGMRVDPEQVVVGAGSEYLTTLLIQLLGPQDGWAVEDPGYPKTVRILASNGVRVHPIPLDEQGLSVDALDASGARVVHVTPSHHFPLGTVMPMPRRSALLSWAEQRSDRYIIEDDYDSEFRFSGRPIPALQGLDRSERVVYLNTFAKSLAPSLRISYLVLPPHLAEEYRRRLLFYSSTVPSFEQHTLALFMERGHFERHIARTRTRYRARKAQLLSAAEAAGLLRHGRVLGADAGLHFLLQLDDPRSEEVLTSLAAQWGVGVYPLSRYYLTSPPKDQLPTFVLGYARLQTEDIPFACGQLARAWYPG